MRHLFKLVKPFTLLFFLIALATLLSCDNSQKNDLKKENVEIVIGRGDIRTGELSLNPSGTVIAHKGKKVTWSIDTNSNVDSFWIEKKENSEQIFIFLDRPPSKPTKKGGGRVDWFARDEKEYEYSIHWREKQDTTWRIFDPKIAVNPSFSYFIYWIIGLLVVGIGLLSLRFRLKSNRKNKN